MQDAFTASYNALNQAQKQAVDTIDGAVLVLAGPGTGKTQLLSTRAGNILRQGDANPSNILCLTYTEAGAAEMRDRMGKVIGPTAGDIAIHTFHSFGSWLISQYPEKFSATRSLTALDDLTRYQILSSIMASFPLRHAFAVRGEDDRFVRLPAVQEAIRAAKQAGLSADELERIIKRTSKSYRLIEPLLDEVFGSTLSAKRLPTVRSAIQTFSIEHTKNEYLQILLTSLLPALETSEATGKTAALGDWRQKHTAMVDGKRVLKSAANAQQVSDLIKAYRSYERALEDQARYDYEDMVLWAVDALETDENIRLDIAERYQYIMVDEYQDTNGAQNRLLDAILKANELQSPNILVVGDDDQAIMRFQGAESSSMLRYIQMYQPTIISLQENYRSAQVILDASRQIVQQAKNRVEDALEGNAFSKLLTSRADGKALLSHIRFSSPSLQYAAIAESIHARIKAGQESASIAVIGRRHKDLVAFAPYLEARGVSVAYDRRANVLEDRHIAILLRIIDYIVSLSSSPARAAALLPEVLALECFNLPVIKIYELAATARASKQTWLDAMLASDDQQQKETATWLIATASACRIQNFTQMLDIVLGRSTLKDAPIESPFKRYVSVANGPDYLKILSHVMALRSAVLEARPNVANLAEMTEVIHDYQLSGVQIVNDNPILRGDERGVQLVTAHGAKGREFETVILLSVTGSVWGKQARGHSQRIALPENLAIYPAGDAEEDKLRLLYVAMTRAKHELILASYDKTDAGKAETPLSYLQLGDDVTGWWQPQVRIADETIQIAAAETAWMQKDNTPTPELETVLRPLLKNLRLSPSSLKNFLDIRYAGPDTFIERDILRFPSAYNIHSALGTAVHYALQQAYYDFAEHGTRLSDAMLLEQFDEHLSTSGLPASEQQLARDHAHSFLPLFFAQFAHQDLDSIIGAETRLRGELLHSHVPFGGAVDAVSKRDGKLIILDYKTGNAPLPNWQTKGLSPNKQATLHFYRQQLLCYKLLCDSALPFEGKSIDSAALVFVEPLENPVDTEQFVRLSIDTFEPQELQRTEQLIAAIYTIVQSGKMPDTSKYSKDLKGILAFEEDLLAN